MVCEIDGFEHIKKMYFVTKEGEIISFANGKERLLKKYPKTGGYYYVCLVDNNGKSHYLRLHRIVAGAFIDNSDNKPYVNHLDGCRTNNNANNLEWVTPKENNHHSLSKRTYCYNLNGDLVKVYDYTRDALKDGFNQGHLCAVARGEEKTHKGHIFSYEELTKQDIVQRLSKPFPKGKKGVEYIQADGKARRQMPKI